MLSLSTRKQIGQNLGNAGIAVVKRFQNNSGNSVENIGDIEAVAIDIAFIRGLFL